MKYTDEDAIFDGNNISTHNVSIDYTSLSELKQDLAKEGLFDIIQFDIKGKSFI